MKMSRAYQIVPYPLGTPEWESFKKFAVAYYTDAMQIAADASGGLLQNEKIYMAVLQATLSPLVFLWEKWQLMTSEAKLPYATPEYKTVLEKRIEEAKKFTEKQLGK